MKHISIKAYDSLKFKRLTDAISGFTNPFSSEINPDELFCLSSGVPAKPNVANDLLQAPDIGATSRDTFIRTRLVERSVGFHEPIKCNELKTFATSGVTKKLTSSLNKMTQVRAERNVFDQLVLLALEHDLDLQLTL